MAACPVYPEPDSRSEAALLPGSPFAQIALGKMLTSAVLGHPISPYYLVLTVVRFAIGSDCREVFTVLQVGILLTFSPP